MLLGVDRRSLRLLRVGTLQQESGGASIPEISAEEQLLDFVVLEDREAWRIRVSLRCALARAEMERPRIRRHRQVDGWNRSTEAGIRHMAGRTRHVLLDRHRLVEIHELAEYTHRFVPVSVKRRRFTRRGREHLPLLNRPV